MKAKLLMTFLMLGALVAAGTVTRAAQSKADEKAVMDTLESMARATIAKDVATLDNIYGDEVTYSHSTSATQTKTQVLADIKGPARLADRRASDHENRAVNRHARHEVDVLGLCFANRSLDEHHDVVLIGPL